MREPYFTPEVKHVGELLHEMQERKVHMAVVVEEHGGTAGIVTFEDLIEEIVGPIRDEYDVAEQEEVQFLNDCEVLLHARFPVDDIKDLLHLDIGETESDPSAASCTSVSARSPPLVRPCSSVVQRSSLSRSVARAFSWCASARPCHFFASAMSCPPMTMMPTPADRIEPRR